MIPGIKTLRKGFPALSKGLYANTASAGPMHETLIQWRQAHEQALHQGASGHFGTALRTIETSRAKLSRFLGCRTDQLAFVPNFSLGMQLLLQMLPKNKTVLLVEEDYPSVNWPFEHQGFKMIKIKVGPHLETRLQEEVHTGKVDVLALSLVQWISGLLLDLEVVKQLKKDRPELTIIADATQFCGMFPFRFKGSGIDVLLASGYKWMLSGYGNGFMAFGDDFMQRHAPTSIGFGSVRGDADKKGGISFCGHFEPGHLDALAFGSLGVSVDFLNEVGMDAIAQRNTALSDRCKSHFLELGLLPEWVAARRGHSTVFNGKIDGRTVQKLGEHGIVCAQRGGGVRFSFNFYNLDEEVDRIAELLKN